jgi:hypothetical protein
VLHFTIELVRPKLVDMIVNADEWAHEATHYAAHVKVDPHLKSPHSIPAPYTGKTLQCFLYKNTVFPLLHKIRS